MHRLKVHSSKKGVTIVTDQKFIPKSSNLLVYWYWESKYFLLNLIDLKILQNGSAHRFQRTRISKEQVLWFDLGFAIR